jgi:hypothetical protein
MQLANVTRSFTLSWIGLETYASLFLGADVGATKTHV